MGQAFWTGVRLPSSPPEYSKDCKRKILQSFFIVLGNVIKKGNHYERYTISQRNILFYVTYSFDRGLEST